MSRILIRANELGDSYATLLTDGRVINTYDKPDRLLKDDIISQIKIMPAYDAELLLRDDVIKMFEDLL